MEGNGWIFLVFAAVLVLCFRWKVRTFKKQHEEDREEKKEE
ncbi:hypothetical protein [Acidaminococcus fermentans]